MPTACGMMKLNHEISVFKLRKEGIMEKLTMTREEIDNCKSYIKELYEESGTENGAVWITGWIVGITDPIHGDLDEVKNELLDYYANFAWRS